MIPQGFRFAGVRCGLKNKRNDLGLIVSDRPARAACLITQNVVRAACCDVTREAARDGMLQGVVVNSGNANCCTGTQGMLDARRMASLAEEALSLPAASLAVASTGVIGQALDMVKVEAGIADAATKLGSDPGPFMDAILTTDLVEKSASAAIPGGGIVYGVAKGSGMIAPNMATMLAFVATDADCTDIVLDAALRRANEISFGCMTVDGDTSTNDMLLVMANGASGIRPNLEAFEAALTEVCVSLAKQVARDGEGATKLIEVVVTGSSDPKRIARTIAESPLVKTAMFGCDPNWGRIMMAAGRAGVPFDPNRCRLSIKGGEVEFPLFVDGGPAVFDSKEVSAALKSDEVRIDFWLGDGERARIYSCDFGYGYVRINAEYHT